MRERRSAGAGDDLDLTALAEAIYRRWPLLMLGIVVGALLAYGLGTVFPTPYRAEAVLLIDFNPELARPFSDMRQRFVFLDFQRRPLEAMAFSDSVLDAVVNSLIDSGIFEGDVGREDLRQHLSLPHPWEGEWHFLAAYQDSEIAAHVANAWAGAFVDRVEVARQRAQSREVQLVFFQELSRRLAREQGRCTNAAAAEALLDDLALELRERPEDGQGELLVTWRLLDIAAWAGVWELDVLPLSQAVSVRGQMAYLTALQGMLAESVRQCPLVLEEIAQKLEGAAAEPGVVSGGQGLSPYLEIVQVREALPPRKRTVPQGTWAFVGGLLGLLTSVIVLALARKRRTRQDVRES